MSDSYFITRRHISWWILIFFFFSLLQAGIHRDQVETERLWMQGWMKNEINKYKSLSRAFIAILRPSPKKRKEKVVSLCCGSLHTFADCLSRVGSGVELTCWLDRKSRFNSYCDKNLDAVESKTCWAGANVEQTWERSLFSASHSGVLSHSSATLPCLCHEAKNSAEGFFLLGYRGEENKTQVPKAIIKLPKPFLPLFNLFVANPANNTLGQ